MEKFDEKKVVVTGGAGFIGSALVRHLIECGAQVRVIDNLVNGKIGNLQGVEHEFHNIDIRDVGKLRPILSDTDVIFHLACLGVRHSLNNPVENHAVNASATLNLLEVCREQEVGRFIYTSTSEVYGTARKVPMDEEHPTFPMTIYGASKLAGECYTRAYWESYQYPTIVVRPFNAYGPRCHHEGDSGEVIPKFILRAKTANELVIFGDGTQTRDFTYVDDTARGIASAALVGPEALGGTFNLGSGEEIRISELAKLVCEIVGSDQSELVFDEPRPGDVLRLFADSGKARDMLAFKPEVTLKIGLSRLVEWYDSSGKSAELLLEEERVRNWLSDD